MLPDFERKLLRILANYSSTKRRMPMMKDLRTMTGRTEEGIYKALDELARQGYINWNRTLPLFSLQIIEAWDRSAPRIPRPTESVLKYWPD